MGEDLEDEALERGYESVTSDESDGCGLEYAFGSDAESIGGLDPQEDRGNLLADFL